jgi:serine/threonine protein phosphatase 1
MRVLAVGDIHGCSRALDAVLAAAAPAPDDLLVALGDYVDRGPDTRGVLDRLIPLHAAGRLVPLLGNHDALMLDARENYFACRGWLNCGGRAALASYGMAEPEQIDLDHIPEAHWRFLERNCLRWYETAAHFFVHANVDPDVPLAEQSDDLLLWEKLAKPVVHISGKVMVCGHTPQRGGRPLDWGRTVCIDTGVYLDGGWLTCLDVASDRYWQANQQGEVREGRLARSKVG